MCWRELNQFHEALDLWKELFIEPFWFCAKEISIKSCEGAVLSEDHAKPSKNFSNDFETILSFLTKICSF